MKRMVFFLEKVIPHYKNYFIFLSALVFLVFLFQPIKTNAQITYTWNAVGIADWTIAVNWAPARTAIAANDILIFNNGSVNTIINVPAETIGQLAVVNNTTVNLQAVNSATLIVWGLAGDDLTVAAGSSFNCNGSNAATIFVAAGATANINGSIIFSGAAHKLNAADNNAIQFNNAAVFVQDIGCSGNVFTTSGAANVIIFNSGSTFIQKAGANPFGLTQPASKVVFNSGSLYKHQQLLFPAFTGRTYANLEIDFPSFNQSALGINLLTIDDLIITQGTLSLNLTGGIHIKGNIIVATGAVLNFNAAAANNLTYNGTTVQSITNAGTLTFNSNEKIMFDNASGILINSNLSFNNEVYFMNGIVTVPNPQMITLSATASVIGVSDNSFVDGAVKKTGNTAFVFPVGKSTGTFKAYVPIEISSPGAVNDEYIAEYKRASAVAISNNYVAGLDHVSGVDYWMLNRTSGTTAVDVTAYWTNTSSNSGSGLYINDITKLTIAHYNGSSQWNSFGGNYITGSGFAAGSIKWTNVNTFNTIPNIFSLGSTDALLNPLPVSLYYFNAVQQGNENLLSWKLNSNGNKKIEISVERSNNGQDFVAINNIIADALSCLQPFEFNDRFPLAGISYYRLKITAFNGAITYSPLLSLFYKQNCLFSLQSTRVNNRAELSVMALQSADLQLAITDIAGNTVLQITRHLVRGSNSFTIQLPCLATGIYYITATTPGNQYPTIRFMKQ